MVTKARTRFVVLVLAILVGLSVMMLSVAPINRFALGTRSSSQAPQVIARAAHLHVLVHLVIFGAIACGAWFVAAVVAQGVTAKLIALAFSMLLGWATEYLQHRVSNGPLEVNDILTNLVSILVAFAILGLIQRYRERKWPPEPKLGQFEP